MEIIFYEEWEKQGEQLFGEDKRNWKFVCPMCGTAQSFNDLLHAGVSEDDAQGYIAFSCIGRFNNKEKGCDWSLGGLLRIHKLEIKVEGKNRPTFEFLKADDVQ
ncbi:MAG: hypothetical protein PHF52_08625 [Sulfurospirillaceae bacterium]|nr:hypothetical protein [Sulfurospirillaceae bacterium]